MIELDDRQRRPGGAERLLDAWEEADIAVPLTVLDSPYRDITRPVINYVRSVRRESPRDLVVVFLPEYIVRHWWEQILHNQTALRLKTALLFTPGVVVASVPWQLGLPGQRHFHHGVRARTAEGIIDADVAMLGPTGAPAMLAKAGGVKPEDITVCILERPRHEEMIAEVRSTGAAIRLITDGDVAGVIHCAEAELTGIDMYMGSGGAPEGVLAAAALKCMGGQMWGRLMFRNDDERGRAAKAGITDLNRIYTRDEMVTADVIFSATGVTNGSIVKGLRREPGFIETETILMRSKTGSVRRMFYRNPVKRA